LVKTRTIEISCLEVWREISNYVDESVSAELRARMEEHLKHCNHCAAILNGTQNVVALVADGRSFDLPTGFGDRLRQRLLSHGKSPRANRKKN
jgi:anti-sigma factor RsiW